MKVTTLLICSSIVLFIVALALILFPEFSLQILDVSTNVTGLMITRILGLAFLGYSAGAWYAQYIIKRFFNSNSAMWASSLFGLISLIVKTIINPTVRKRRRRRTA